MGNQVLTSAVKYIFGNNFHKVLYDYKLFSRKFVKSFPIFEAGFGIETELTVHALELHLPTGHAKANYYDRPEGSFNKLNTYRDGARMLLHIIKLLKHNRRLLLFASIGSVLTIIGLGFIIPILLDYFSTSLVSILPSLISGLILILVSIFAHFSNLILYLVSKARKESKLISYLSISR